MEASFDNTVAVLVKAYLDGTLRKRDCAACAVGNICAAAIGAKVTPPQAYGYLDSEWTKSEPMWANVFCVSMHNSPQVQTPANYIGKAKAQIDATGYTWQELARVEVAFERAHPAARGSEAEYAGLMAVVDVLADIHGIDLTAAQAAKELFVKA